MTFSLHANFRDVGFVWDDPSFTAGAPVAAVPNPVHGILAALVFFGEDVALSLSLFAMLARPARSSDLAKMSFDVKYHPREVGHRFCVHAKAVRHPRLQAAPLAWMYASCGHESHLTACSKAWDGDAIALACCGYLGNMRALQGLSHAEETGSYRLWVGILGAALDGGQIEVVHWLLQVRPKLTMWLQRPIQTVVRVVDVPVHPISLVVAHGGTMTSLLADAGCCAIEPEAWTHSDSTVLAQPLLNAIRNRQLTTVRKLIDMGFCPPMDQEDLPGTESVLAAIAASDDWMALLAAFGDRIQLSPVQFLATAVRSKNPDLVASLFEQYPCLGEDVALLRSKVDWRDVLYGLWSPWGSVAAPSQLVTSIFGLEPWMTAGAHGRTIVHGILSRGGLEPHAAHDLLISVLDRAPQLACIVDNARNPPLHWLIVHQREWGNTRFMELIKLLMSHGADPTRFNRDGQSAVHLAVLAFFATLVADRADRWMALFSLWQSKQIDLKVKNAIGVGPLELAIKMMGAQSEKIELVERFFR